MHRFRDWANLPSEIVEIFMNKMDFPGMFNFGRICSSWRSLSSPIFKSTVESLLILEEDSYDNGSIWIYNPLDGIPYQVRLPVGFTKGKICGFTNESLVLEEEENGNGISLLRLFSSTATDAIHLLPLPVHSESKKICLSSDESIAMAITRNTDKKLCTFNIFICNTKQDLSWNLIEIPHLTPNGNPVVEDIIFSKGKFYAITSDGLIVIVHASTAKCYETTVYCAQAAFHLTYLADSLEYGLIFITMATRPDRRISHLVWKNIEIDENFEYANKQFDRIGDLGDHAVFVSCNHARVISTADSPDLKKNMVYNTPDSRRHWKDMDHGEFFNEDESTTSPVVTNNFLHENEVRVTQVADNVFRTPTKVVNSSIKEPQVGMIFKTNEEALKFYETYGVSKGFSVITRSSRKNWSRCDLFTSMTFACSHYGSYNKKK